MYVYNVTPDDHYYPNTTCHHCHNIQHYLLNTTKYFTSNTQLLFLPGLHHLHTDLIIQNVHNISLIGCTTNGTTPDTVIHCNSSVGIVMTNITNLTVTNITIRSCLGNEYNNATVLIKKCTNVQLRHVVIEESHNSYGIVGINILGDSHFSYITNNAIIITYDDITATVINVKNHNFFIDHYHVNDIDSNFTSILNFTFLQHNYTVKVRLVNSSMQDLDYKGKILSIYFNNKNHGKSIFIIKSCNFANNHIHSNLLYIASYDMQHGNAVWLEDSTICNNQFSANQEKFRFIEVKDGPDINVVNCSFDHNYNGEILRVIRTKILQKLINVTIANTVFSANTGILGRDFIALDAVRLHLRGPVIFSNISNCRSVINLRISNITLYNYIEFVSVTTKSIIYHIPDHPNMYFNVFIVENTKVIVTHSRYDQFAISRSQRMQHDYHPCYFQYLSDRQLDGFYNSGNYSVIFESNFENSAILSAAYINLPLIHCSWLAQTAFTSSMPLEVNSNYIKYINKVGEYQPLTQMAATNKKLCYCDSNSHHDCNSALLSPIYPGQTMTMNMYIESPFVPPGFTYSNYTIITVLNATDWLPSSTCIVTNSSELSKTVRYGICTTVKYTIVFPTKRWCELFFIGFYVSIHSDVTEMYYIKALPCPAGFILINGICQCSSFLGQYNIKCNINDQTLQRPANAWITPIPHNKSYMLYTLSLNCPFHYCLPYPSHLNFITPDSQCQFNRSGILCGHCQQGLSTVFGSSHCQQCSNIYLFLIVPIAIAGLVLVLLLFILNLTVTDGTINAFIFYVNIISINTPVFFPNVSSFTPSYTFISLANLDLGIQTCFYNGMDDYAKMWLQLAFPFYLIFIAISLIITSRYSTTIQRLTARRALPVLATLFLLSYTKILLVVSSVLFSYSKIIHLPNGHTSPVWSVDANITLLAGRFIILFLISASLFLILIPFNVILLFTRTLSRFKFITKFKPILDAYQGPYKVKFYYWTGLQLVIRTVVFGLSSLDRKVNLVTGTILLSILGGVHGIMQPFINEIKNYQELVLIINLQAIYTSSLYDEDANIILNIMITMAAVHLTHIVLYHIITYLCHGVIRNKMELYFTKLTGKIRGLYKIQPAQGFELEATTRDKIPEVTYCYNEYQEPLVGYSH